MSKDKDTINSIDRALNILLLLYDVQKELGVTEIGRHLGLYKSTVHRTLAALENKGFVQQNPENGKYWLGMKIYALGMVVGEKMSLKHLIKPYATELSQKFNEAVNVSILDTNAQDYPKTILILKEEGSTRLQVNPSVGSSSESHCSAVGKCLLAFSPKEALEKLEGKEFPIYTKNTIGNWEQLVKQLEVIRLEGYAIDNEELEIGLTCVAAPIFDKDNKAIASISISGPTSRIHSSDIDKIIKEVKMTAYKISSLMK
ncbi:IclR family transcriptional regulator [Clostridiaceae bacterium 35-E11]